MRFEIKEFNIRSLQGISEKSITEHLKLYAGYVKHTNLILEIISETERNSEKNIYTLNELNRRFSFEFNGMRLHEYFFNALSGEAKEINSGSKLYKEISSQFGDFTKWFTEFKSISLTRGIGWSLLCYDAESKLLKNIWVSEHEIGNIAGLKVILALDMWEHSYLMDYIPSEKKNYIDAFFSNINWATIENNFV